MTTPNDPGFDREQFDRDVKAGLVRPASLEEVKRADELLAKFQQRVEVRRHNEAIENEKHISNDGAFELKVGNQDGMVIVDFGTSLTWFGMTGDEAAGLAMVLMNHARAVGLTKPVTLSI